MRISAASLTAARVNPGHLSVEKVVALVGAMGECSLRVFSDLLAEAGAKQRRKEKNEYRIPNGCKIAFFNSSNSLVLKISVARG